MGGDDLGEDAPVELNSYRVRRSGAMIHSELRSLYSYWNTLRAGRKTPLRSDIDPRDMDCDARNLFILENLGRGNIRFRLAGTAIVDAFGMEMRGMNARTIMSAGSRESFTALIAETLEDPGVGYARLRDVGDDTALWEVNLLPLRSDFGMIDRVIGCLHPLTTMRRNPGLAPLRFSIEHMTVDPIAVTVRDLDLPLPAEGFAEQRSAYQAGNQPDAPQLRSIQGGLDTGGMRSQPTRGHLRLVKD